MAASNKIIRLQEAAKKRSQDRDLAKLELARHAIAALAELGYARTSMRDIAAQSGRSIGALNYYFEDKVDLIKFCVRLYKKEFVEQIDEIINTRETKDGLTQAIVDGFVQTIEDDAITHRLWYDIRSQSLFDENFHTIANEIEQALIDMIERLLKRIGISGNFTNEAYYLLDSSFRIHLQRHLQDQPNNSESFRTELNSIFSKINVLNATN